MLHSPPASDAQVTPLKKAVCFEFRLYVAGDTPNSEHARVHLGALCRKYLMGRYKIQIVDVFKDPNRAMIDGVYMTPTLIKLAPSPVRMVVGTLAPSESLMEALGLSAVGV
jgi:circadian clock protein KaiB